MESSYASQITTSSLPGNFKIHPISDYDGKGDPTTHIEDFQTHPSFYNLPDEIACRVFPLTLKEEAREWFEGLESVNSFNAIKR
jgi:hypothetical protein